jgi:xylulokinase
MAYLLGIDIGTSGTKVIAIDESGKLVASAGAEYPLSTPKPLWAEQNANDWWDAVCACCRKIVAEIGADNISSIGLSGQMHGLVMLDSQRRTAASGDSVERWTNASAVRLDY